MTTLEQDFAQAAPGLLRFITCGSVDDGKSTLLGRMLYDAGIVPEDQLSALKRDSHARPGGTDGKLDFSLLTDGLDAERQQGITIDVAYRYFHTSRRSFIVADCPGHEQYTRNMATGASTADVAVVLIDARKGVLAQTRRHAYICSLLGIRHVVVAVNKMDLVGYSQPVYDAIAESFLSLSATFGFERIECLPVVAVDGDNVGKRSTTMDWFQGEPLLSLLENAAVPQRAERSFRLPVQWVNRPDQNYRGYAGTVSGGRVSVGDELVAQPGTRRACVQSIQVAGVASTTARAGQAVTLTLDHEIDVSRGDVLALATQPCEVSSQFGCHLLWMGDEPLLPHRTYWLKIGTRTINAQVTSLKYKVDVDTQAHLAATRLALNEVAFCNIDLDDDIPFDRYAADPVLGGFILIDRASHATVACGMIDFALRRSANVHWQHVDVDKDLRAKAKGQVPLCVWFTGLSGAGKSTIANLVEKKLAAAGYHTYLLDGDNVRHGLNNDLGFTAEARVENVRRIAEVAHLMTDAGLIVLVCAISPFVSERRFARERFAAGEFVEVFVDAALSTCEARDPKGLYGKARAGQIANFTGIDSPYEPPLDAEEHLHTDHGSAEALSEDLTDRLMQVIRRT